MSSFRSLEWKDNKLYLLDQTRLLHYKEMIICNTYKETAEAIKAMKVRGAPAIGVSAAYGIVLGMKACEAKDHNEFFRHLDEVSKELKNTRPTAVNLFWAIDKMVKKAEENRDKSIDDIRKLLEDEADRMADEDIEVNRVLFILHMKKILKN